MQRFACLLLVAVLVSSALPTRAMAVEESDFLAATTQNLMNLCTAPANDPMREEAVHFCHGYLVGAFHYYLAQSAGPDGVRLVCLPDPAPSRAQTISMFLDWAKTHPEYMDERPVQTQFRFLMETWPCP